MKVWTKEEIRAKLVESAVWRDKAVVSIYGYQTADEQMTDATRHHNGVGFNGVDAGILSDFARQIKAGRNMSAKQALIIEKKMPKYAKQLTAIANMKAEAASASEKIFS